MTSSNAVHPPPRELALGAAYAVLAAIGFSAKSVLAKIIYAQELQHYHKNRLVFDREARAADPSAYSEALKYARELAHQHFLLRNDSFGSPLSAERVAQIEAGHVTPYVPPRLY